MNINSLIPNSISNMLNSETRITKTKSSKTTCVADFPKKLMRPCCECTKSLGSDLDMCKICHKTLSAHKYYRYDLFMINKYQTTSNRPLNHQKKRHHRSFFKYNIDKLIYKLVRTVAVITKGGKMLSIMLLTLITVLIQKSKQLLLLQQPTKRHNNKKKFSKERVYLLTTVSMLLLINVATLQQVHCSENLSSSGSSSNSNNRRSGSIERTDYINQLIIINKGSLRPEIQQNQQNQQNPQTISTTFSNNSMQNNTHSSTVAVDQRNTLANESDVHNSSLHTTPQAQLGLKTIEHKVNSIQITNDNEESSMTINNRSQKKPLNSTNHIFNANNNNNKTVPYYPNATISNFTLNKLQNRNSFINTSTFDDGNLLKCSSCQSRERAKLYTLESIKNQILRRLRLEKPPNISTPVQVPSKILEEFYKKLNATQDKERHNLNLENTYRQQTDRFNKALFDRSADKSTSQNGDFDYSIDIQNDDASVTHPYSSLADEIHFPTNDDVFYHDDDDYFDNSDDELHSSDEFYSRVNSVFLFPTKPRFRHNRKLEILNFKLEPNYFSVTRAIFHIYIRGIDWIREHNPALLELKHGNITIKDINNIVLTVHRAVRRQNSLNYSHSIKLVETRVKLPPGLGQWINIEVKQLSTFWKNNPGMTQGVIVKGLEKWMRPLIVTGEKDEALTVHIEVKVKEKRRPKRSLSFDCKESDNEKRCCRYPLKVNFTNFGWDFVIAPTSFDAYFCNGECNIGFNPKHTHTYVASLALSASPCCSPTKMSSLSLLYFNDHQILVMSTIPNMSVEQCSCL